MQPVAKQLIAEYLDALDQGTVNDFLEQWSLSDDQLTSILDDENAKQGFGPDDPHRFTLEWAQGYMDSMRQGVLVASESAKQAAELADHIDLAKASVQQVTTQGGFGDPPVKDAQAILEVNGTQIYLNFSWLSVADKTLRLGPSTRVRFEGYGFENLIALQIIEALRNRDGAYYVDHVLASRDDFEALLRASMAGMGADVPEDIDAVYERTIENLKSDFQKLLETGDEKGVDWSSVEMTWSGLSSTLQGEVYQLSIPFQFTSGDVEYRVVLDFCSQLQANPRAFLPGEFRWEGQM